MPSLRSPVRSPLSRGGGDLAFQSKTTPAPRGYCSLTVFILAAAALVALNILWSSYAFVHGPVSTLDKGSIAVAPTGLQYTDVRNGTSLPVSGGLSNSVHYPLFSTLPSFTDDDSDIIMGSIIEIDDNLAKLFLASIFLARHVLEPSVRKEVHVGALKLGRLNNTIRTLDDVKYKANGQRSDTVPYTCRVKHSNSSKSYILPGVFVPNRQTFDPNSNRRVEILRCGPLSAEGASISRHISRDDKLYVEILREESVIIRYQVPWRTRRTGYLLTAPPSASRWNAWAGSRFDEVSVQAASKPGSQVESAPRDRRSGVFMCVPKLRRYPSRSNVVYLLEFVQHHLNIGVGHIFLGASFPYNSSAMTIYTQLLHSYITQGKVSLVSDSGDGYDGVASLLGLKIDRIDSKTFFNNMCLYMAKGTSKYAAMWDHFEFFIPSAPYSTIAASVAAAEADENQHRAAAGMHPACFVNAVSKVFLPLYPHSTEANKNWIGTRFAYGGSTRMAPSRAIVPTSRVFYSGMLSPGACALPPAHTSCGANSDRLVQGTFCMGASSSANRHDVDDVVAAGDGAPLSADKYGLLYHFNTFVGSNVAPAPQSGTNLYVRDWYMRVMSQLRMSGMLSILDAMPADMVQMAPGSLDNTWIDFNKAYVSNPAARAAIGVPDFMANGIESLDQLDCAYSKCEEHVASAEHINVVTELPEFASDLSELFMSALIERNFESPDLHLVVFMMNRAQVLRKAAAGLNIEVMNKSMEPLWNRVLKAFEKTEFIPSGARSSKFPFFCNISLAAGSDIWAVSRGHFIPTRTSPDANANRRVEIMRCPMSFDASKFKSLYKSNQSLEVTIKRHDNELIRFQVPWHTRRTGYMMTSPRGGSRFDAWKGVDALHERAEADPLHVEAQQAVGDGSSTAAASGSRWESALGQIDDLYMCVPGMESPFDRKIMPLYAEFVEHHIQLGVQHMFISASYIMTGTHMKLLVNAFRSYIRDGLVSVTSQSGDNIDFLYGYKGLVFDRDNIKVAFVNMCLYYSKGVADYVGVWDFDEFFIPQRPHESIMDVVRAAEGPGRGQALPTPRPGEDLVTLQREWQPRPGFADKDAHPFCYLLLNSETINSNGEAYDEAHAWIGERFSHLPESTHLSFQKSIHPTRRIFYAGLHVGGTCRLPVPWNGCSKEEMEKEPFCLMYERAFGLGGLGKVSWLDEEHTKYIDFRRTHGFDEATKVDDARRIDMKTDAIIYHIQAHRAHLLSKAHTLEGLNEYALRFYDKVFQGLKRRGLVLMQTLPNAIDNAKPKADKNWLKMLDLLSGSVSAGVTNIKSYVSSLADSASGHEWKPPIGESVVGFQRISNLPGFSMDRSEFVLGSIIERQSGSRLLHLTTFFLASGMLHLPSNKDAGSIRVAPSVQESWIQFASTKRDSNDKLPGKVTAPGSLKFVCRMAYHGAAARFHEVEGEFVPNRGTPDSNANRRLSILRCPMPHDDGVYSWLYRSNESVVVSIHRRGESSPVDADQDLLIRFAVPWRSRRSGYALESPATASRYDAWKGLARTADSASSTTTLTSTSERGGDSRDRVHLCVPGMESHPDKTTYPQYMEFVQHHVDLGVDHIHLSSVFAWDGAAMDLVQQMLRTYIDEGKVSVTTMAADGLHGVYSTHGLKWHRDDAKVFALNMCFYLSKGVADYVGIWDLDEFFIPRAPLTSLVDVVAQMESDSRAGAPPAFPSDKERRDVAAAKLRWRGGPGMADGQGHPYCYLMLRSEAIFNDPTVAKAPGGVTSGGTAPWFDYTKPWIGQRYSHRPEDGSLGDHMAFVKSLVPTDRIFQVGLHMHGACHLPAPWNGASAASDSSSNSAFYYSKNEGGAQQETDFAFTHPFDATVWQADTKLVDPSKYGVIYHFQINRRYLAATNYSLRRSLGEQNEYVKRFFPSVLKELNRRGLVLPEVFPSSIAKHVLYLESPGLYIPYTPYMLKYLNGRDLFP